MNRYDDKKNYCRMLGHQVSFRYCRTTASDSPCRKIKDCWFELLAIEDYMNEHFSPEEQQRIFKAPENKVTSLLDLIEKARQRMESGNKPSDS